MVKRSKSARYIKCHIIVTLVLMAGCTAPPAGGGGEDDDIDFDKQPDAETVAAMQTISDDLVEFDDQLTALLATTDEEDAKQQIADTIAAGPDVEWAVADSQGISILYKNGFRTGLWLDPEDDEADAPDPNDADLPTQAKSSGTPRTVAPLDLPGARRTIFLNPHNWERQTFASQIVASANACFDRCQFQRFESYLGEEVTLARLMALADYGVIHFYSHGHAWPRKESPEAIYMLTGQIADAETKAIIVESGLQAEIITKRVRFRNRDEKHEMFLVSAEFITDTNNFSTGKPFVYLGFCHSWRGTWQDKLRADGATAFVGFDWAVKTSFNAWWARDLYYNLGNTSLDTPTTLALWHAALGSNESYSFLDTMKTESLADDVTRTVKVNYAGSGQMTFWEEEPTPTGFVDPCLERALEEALAGLGLELTNENLAQLGGVSLYGKGIHDLTGLEHCVNLTWLDAAYNHVSDLTPLAGLTALETLRIDGNLVTDLTPLSNLASLTFLRVQHQQGDILTNLNGVESLSALEKLFADGNAITSIAPLESLANLQTVTLSANAITDLTPLTQLANLTSVNLNQTHVDDIGPMLDSPALNGLALNVFCTNVDPNCDPNQGDTTQCMNAAAMEAAGATVTMPDPTRACTPGPDGTDPFPSPECDL